MDDQPGVSVQRRRTPAEIEEIAAAFAGSGLTRSKFCRREHVGLGTLNRYLQRKSESGAVEMVAVELAGTKLATCGEAAACNLAVVLSRGRRIEVGAGFDAPTLQRLVNLLEKT